MRTRAGLGSRGAGARGARARLAFVVCVTLAFAASGCGTTSGADDNGCSPGDQDGVTGGIFPVIVNVSDTGFYVGGIDSGSTEMNITTENLGKVSLTLNNVGTKPHDLVVGCLPSGLPAACYQVSCFPNPDDAGATATSVTLVPTLQPGQSATVNFVTPAVEGTYPFVSDVPGDSSTFNDISDGGATGMLTGAFVLM